VSSLVFACAVGAIYAVLAVGRAIQGAIEARRSDSAALRWSARRRRAKALRAADRDATRLLPRAWARRRGDDDEARDDVISKEQS
jgi:hypothetical protein